MLTLKKLHSRSTSQASVIQTTDVCLILDADDQMTGWGEYFREVFTVDPAGGQLQTAGLQTLNGDPPNDKTGNSIDDVKELW